MDGATPTARRQTREWECAEINASKNDVLFDMKSFGALVWSLRVESGLSQARFAQKAKISAPYLSQIENDRVPPPPIDVCERLLDAVGATAPQKTQGILAATQRRSMLGARVGRNTPKHVARLLDRLHEVGHSLTQEDVTSLMSKLKEKK